MPRKDMPKAPVASMPLWKAVLMGAGLGLICGFFGWLAPSVLHHGLHGRWPPVSAWPAIHFGFFTLISIYMWWAWRPRRKHGRWLRWCGSVAFTVYLSALFIAGGVIYWDALLAAPWSWIVNGVSIALFILVWVLPAISQKAARRIAFAQDRLSFKMLAFGGPAALMVTAGILGANFGLHGGPSAEGQVDPRLVVFAFALPILGIGLAQYNAHHFWPYRPWQKDGEA